jgi:hypothetical protein
MNRKSRNVKGLRDYSFGWSTFVPLMKQGVDSPSFNFFLDGAQEKCLDPIRSVFKRDWSRCSISYGTEAYESYP